MLGGRKADYCGQQQRHVVGPRHCFLICCLATVQFLASDGCSFAALKLPMTGMVPVRDASTARSGLLRIPRRATDRAEEEAAAADSRPPAMLSRRRPLGVAAGVMLGAMGSSGAVSAAEPKVTNKITFELTSQRDKSQLGKQVLKTKKITIGLYGQEAPVLTRNFMQACTKTYPGSGGRQVWYKNGCIKSLDPGKSIGFIDFADGNLRQVVTQVESSGNTGAMLGTKITYLPLADDDTRTDEENALRHDVLGRVSMKKGGGTFDFEISPVEKAPWLDKTNVVIGQVLDGFDVIQEWNSLATYRGKPINKIKIIEITIE